MDKQKVGRAPYNFSWIISEFLCASAYIDRQMNMQFLRESGVRHVICLASDFCPHPYEDITVHLIDIEEFEPPSLQQIDQFMDICKTAKEQDQAVCVQCRMGLGRTGVMLACYLVRHCQLIPQQAIAKVRQLRPYSIETTDQEFVVKEYWDHVAWNKKK